MSWLDKVIGVGEGIFNIGSSISNYRYQQELQNQIFSREDNAVQRRAADFEKAGLSKTLAAGSAAGAGSVVQTDSPQMSLLDRIATSKAIDKTSAEIAYTNELAANARKDNLIKDETIRNMIAQRAQIIAQTALLTGQTDLLGVRSDYMKVLMDKAEAETKKVMAEQGLVYGQKANLNIQNQIMRQQLQLNVEKLLQEQYNTRYLQENSKYPSSSPSSCVLSSEVSSRKISSRDT